MANRETRQYDDGSVYEGELKDGKRHGRGTFAWATGDRFVSFDVSSSPFYQYKYHGVELDLFANYAANTSLTLISATDMKEIGRMINSMVRVGELPLSISCCEDD